MAYLRNLTATDPMGQESPMLLNGSTFTFRGPLAANATTTTGWLPVGSYIALLYIIQSDQIGSVSAVEYSTDAVNVNASGTARAYSVPNRLLQVALTLKDKYFRITYTNGPTAATSVYFECKLSTTAFQNTMASVHQPATQTNIASLVKSIIELDAAPGSGNFEQIYRTGNSMNVFSEALGTKTDPTATNVVDPWSQISLLKSILLKLSIQTDYKDYMWMQAQAGNSFLFSTGVISGLASATNIRALITNANAAKTMFIYSVVIDNASSVGGFASMLSNPTTGLPTTSKGAGTNPNMGSSNVSGCTVHADTNATALSGGASVPSLYMEPNSRTSFLEDDQVFLVPPGGKLGLNIPIGAGTANSYQVVLYAIVG